MTVRYRSKTDGKVRVYSRRQPTLETNPNFEEVVDKPASRTRPRPKTIPVIEPLIVPDPDGEEE
jgi:hypothetical protein